ncbi:uncharacterized protein LOC143290725 [Babylonia areolata]|uniref:uncharacterized protein LOC143290725 n=1 Tax=Babylonia areolata TaxID=304850 RepID=UPI003FD28A50
MRISFKIAFGLILGLAIFQAYHNINTLLAHTGFKASTLSYVQERVFFPLTKRQQKSIYRQPERTTPYVLKAEHNSASSSPPENPRKSPVVLKQHVPQSSERGHVSVLSLANKTRSSLLLQSEGNARPQPQTRTAHWTSERNITVVHTDESKASVGQGFSLTGDPRSDFSSLSFFSLLTDYLKPVGHGKIPEARGVIARDVGKILVSTVSGEVRLPLVMWASRVGDNLPACPEKPPTLIGFQSPVTPPQKVRDLEQRFSFLFPGGDYSPPDCRPQQRVAVIIPYRNRWTHLHVLLNNLVPFLARQQASFTIFVIEQEPPSTFNRALLLNVGVLEASLIDLYTCFIFHDVDLIPLNDYNLYRCGELPKHFSVAINKFNYRLPYAGCIGGVTGLSREHVEKVNGNSNLYFGWGGEDDELMNRLRARGLSVARDPPQIARYDMFRHSRDKGNEQNPARFQLLKSTKRRMHQDGLSSLKYNVTSMEFKPLYTWIKVKVDPRQFMQNATPEVRKMLERSLRAPQPKPRNKSDTKAAGGNTTATGVNENKSITGVSQEKSATGVSEKKTIAGVSQEKSATGVSEKKTIAGVSQEKSATGVSEKKTIAGVNLEKSATGVSENKSIAGVSQEKSATGVSEKKSITGVSQEKSATGVSEKKTITGVSPEKSATGVSEKKTIAGVNQEKSATGVSEKKTIAGVSQEKSATGVSEKKSIAGVSQEKNATGVKPSGLNFRL